MNTSSLFVAAALVTGALVPLQLAFNAQLGAVTRNPYTAGLIVFVIGAIALSATVAAMRPPLPSLSSLASAPPTVWLGGLIATGYILAIVIVTPKLGVGSTTILILAGQILMALVLDHLGAFGNPQHSLNLWRVSGAVLVVAGVVVIRTH